MRHVRMRILGIGLLVALFASAIGAGSALASKDPYTVNSWAQYKACPYENEELTNCFYGRTAGGKEGGEFQYGKVRVLLNKPIVIQGGFKGSGPNVEVAPATHGGETLESPELPIVKGLNVITPQIQEEAEWPTALKESFKAAKQAKEIKAFAKIEFAGTECFETKGCLSSQNLIEEEGPAFKLALKVKITNAWLEKLGGGPCYVGSDEHPIAQNLTSEGAGRVGLIEFSSDFLQIELKDTELVDVGWHINIPSGPHGCGGEFESYVDHALALALEGAYGSETPSSEKGITWLTGNLHTASRQAVATKGIESGELP